MPELVPHDQSHVAAQLSSIDVDLARVIGPAVAGILIAHYMGWGRSFHRATRPPLLQASCRPLWQTPLQIPEPFVSAPAAPAAEIFRPRYTPVVRRILSDHALFTRFGRCSHRGEPPARHVAGTGCYLVPLGSGHRGASVLSKAHVGCATNALIGLMGGIRRCPRGDMVLVRSTWCGRRCLLATGMAWVAMLLQLFLRWVGRARVVPSTRWCFGHGPRGACVGGGRQLVWADRHFLVAAGLMAAGAASNPHLAVGRHGPEALWFARSDGGSPNGTRSGPVVVTTTYNRARDRLHPHDAPRS